jgi:hypothetical protein
MNSSMRRLFALTAATVALAFFFGRETVYVNVSPAARLTVNGSPRFLNGNVEIDRRSADVAIDGFIDDQYAFEMDGLGKSVEMTLSFPFPMEFARVSVVGGSEPIDGSVSISGAGGPNGDWQAPKLKWRSEAGKPPIVILNHQGGGSRLVVVFDAATPVVVNSIQVHVQMPRWLAWSWFLGLQIAVPWIVGGVFTAAIFGWGAMVRATSSSTSDEESPTRYWVEASKNLTVGLAAIGVVAAIWLCLSKDRREGTAAWVVLAAVLSPSVRWLRPRSRSVEGRRFAVIAAAAALLFLSTVAVDSTLASNRRAKPIDHLTGLLAAEHLTTGQRVPEYLVLRPWLIPLLVAPVTAASGDVSYWFYLGQLAWINAAGLVGIGLLFAQFRVPPFRATALIAILPVAMNYHFPGPRVLVGGLTLIAVSQWTARTDRRWHLWGGLAAGLAFLVHPGALFSLPAAAVHFLFSGERRTRWNGLAGVAVALAVFVAWSSFIRLEHPEVRNKLAYYPLMRTLEDPLPTNKSFLEIVRQLPRDHWRELARNRLLQLRHYLWADNPWQTTTVEALRPISLTTSVGVVLTICLLWNPCRFAEWAFWWAAILGPLLVFHLHMGQAYPQFHIVPTPFFGLAVICAAAASRCGGWVIKLAVIESLAFHAFVPTLVLMGFAGDFELPGWFIADSAAKWLILFPVLPWAVLARIAWTDHDL